MKWVLLYLVTNTLCNICNCKEVVEVKIKQGVLSGKVERTWFKEHKYYAFRGIPYALPPVDALRFKPPVEHNGWEGIYEAYDNKPPCYQYTSKIKFGTDFVLSGSEDCLYISVFSPSLERSAPVLVFEYNDDFKSTNNVTEEHSPDFFLEQDITVVVINHRLGIFGYLTTNDDIIPPNAGLKDFILGLKWIKENIGKFGGDPNRITVMGNRGGAVLVDILLHSEKTIGLFNAAIIQSGTALESSFFDKDPREKTFKLAKALKIEVNESELLLTELQKLDAKTLISNETEAIDDTLMDKYQIKIFPFSPTIEENSSDAVLTLLPENGNVVNDVPVLIGMNSREGLDIAGPFVIEPRMVADLKDEFPMIFPIRSSFAFDRKSTEYNQAIKEILNFYFKEGYFYFGNVLEYAIYVGDMLQNYALNLEAQRLSKTLKSPVYYYVFDFRGLLNINSEYLARYARSTMKHWGANIGDDLCYLLLCKRIEKTYETLNNLMSEQPEFKVMKKMVRLWSNFVKTGNPTPREDELLNGFKWEPIEKNNEGIAYLQISKHLKMKANPLGKREKFWDNFLDKYSKLAVDGIVGKKEATHDEL